RVRSPTGRHGASRRTTSRRRSPPPPRRASAATPPWSRASGRSRCPAASASRGSTSSTGTTSARLRFRRTAAIRASSARRSPPGSSTAERRAMDGLMMDFQLTLPPILKRAETYFGGHEIVTRLPDKSFHRYTYGDFGRRARALAVGLQDIGLARGDRVATMCWNHYQHLAAYFGIPCGGLVLHTLNLRLHPSDIGYIAKHGCDKAVIVDR